MSPGGRGHGDRSERIRRIMETEGDAVREQSTHSNDLRYEAIDRFPAWDQTRAAARTQKEDAIDRLPELIETVTSAVEEAGGSVYVADDAAEANTYVADVAASVDAESVVKSKSMTTEEIDLNEHLESTGVEVWETDLGEFVVQLADESPSHIVGPAMHKTTEEIADLFADRFDPEDSLDSPEALTQFAREILGDRICEADVGVTGANFVLAESGSIVLVTNEGNARKSAVTPDVHVAVAGVEKLLPSVEELRPFLRLLSRAATGQQITRYVSVLSPPTATPTMDVEADSWGVGEREFHLVLLDNGRFELRDDPDLRETLYCIRCGACSNACSNFQHVGGHAFGGETYSGGIATGWEWGVHGPQSAADSADLCTGCTRCVDACPVEIDVPWINTVVQDRLNRGTEPTRFDHLVDGLVPDDDSAGVPLEKRFYGAIETIAPVGSATAPVSNWLAERSVVRRLLEATVGLDRNRELPTFARTTFVDWFEDRGGVDRSIQRARGAAESPPYYSSTESSVASGDRAGSGPTALAADAPEVVIYPDTYTNYVVPERGVATVRTLEALGVAVDLTPPVGSGRAPLSQGMIESARRSASECYATLAEHVDAGRSIAVIEPSDLAIFEREYARLLPERPAGRLSDVVLDPASLVLECLDAGADARALSATTERTVVFHGHCQGRTVGATEAMVTLLERLGYDVVTTTFECCGMAGSFGYKKTYADLSRRVGRTLVDSLPDDQPVVATGVSCREQLESLSERSVRHPLELVAPGRSERGSR